MGPAELALFPHFSMYSLRGPLLRRLKDGGSYRGTAWNSTCCRSLGEGVRVILWRHHLCIPLFGHRGSERGGCQVWAANFNKGESLWLGAWRGGGPLPGPFHDSEGPAHFIGVWLRPDRLLEGNWSDLQVEVEAQVGTWLRRRLYLKSRLKVFTVFIPGPLLAWCTSPAYGQAADADNLSSCCCGKKKLQWSADRSTISIFAMEAWRNSIWRVIGLMKSWHSCVDHWRRMQRWDIILK